MDPSKWIQQLDSGNYSYFGDSVRAICVLAKVPVDDVVKNIRYSSTTILVVNTNAHRKLSKAFEFRCSNKRNSSRNLFRNGSHHNTINKHHHEGLPIQLNLVQFNLSNCFRQFLFLIRKTRWVIAAGRCSCRAWLWWTLEESHLEPTDQLQEQRVSRGAESLLKSRKFHSMESIVWISNGQPLVQFSRK